MARKIRVSRAATLLLASSLVLGSLAACGSSSKKAASSSGGGGGAATTTSGAASSGGKLTPITVDNIPISDAIAVTIAVKQGYFTKAGFDVTLKSDPQGGAGTVPSIISGKTQFGVAGISDVIAARSKGFPVTAIAGLSAGPTTEAKDQNWLSSLSSSGITSMKQLVGKTIAVSTLGGLSQIQVQEAFVNAGLSPNSAKFVSINFPQLPSAIINHRAAAAALVEPFVTQAQGMAKINLIAGTDFATGPSTPGAVLMVTQSYLDKNRALVLRFQKAVQQALTYAAANPAVVRQLLPAASGLPASLAAKIRLPFFVPQINVTSVKRLQDDMVKFKIITKTTPLDQLVLSS